jgi:DNA-binding GntR family transcriptional regulator
MVRIDQQWDDDSAAGLPVNMAIEPSRELLRLPRLSPGYPNPLLAISSTMPATQRQTQAKPKPTEDFIYNEIYNAILERRLPPDTKLGENSLAEHYGVSRTIIRQVLQRLSHDRLVKQEPNRGAFVASLSLEEAKQIYAAWRLTEAAIVRDVTQSITPPQVAALRALIAEERQACEQQDLSRLTRLSAQFHMQLADLCRNKFLAGFLKELVPQTSLAFFYEVQSMPVCGKDEHTEILDCIEAGDVEVAVAAAMRHLDGIEAAFNARALLKRTVSLEDILKARVPSL